MNTAIGYPEKPIVIHACQVTKISSLSDNTYQIELASPEGSVLDYYAGQHLQLSLDVNGDGQLQPLLYSIANGFDPEKPNRLQLIIQNNSEFSDKVLNRIAALLNVEAAIPVTLPMGQAFLQTNLSQKHLLIASGSGIAKIKCLIETILRQQPNADVNIYWSNKHADEFYLHTEFQDWLTNNQNLTFTPILESAHPDWSSRSGYIYEVIQQDYDDLSDVQVYLCGSPQMVYGTIDKLAVIGLKENNCYSDAFQYAPRT
ncbi:FAD-binding oxidoreductase [Methylophaga sp. OBS3]|uniref:FAD-binding oxidoreductase n=1 Tax=Methylophaga sp. OBS3 TaxID=2991934 RepID=UPI00224E7451|nr:FAD-binding oxidoreductase [Methylophaga sp. OBS3]MCX4189107.1 FAD-binding oxidoreductase [Methylophaga sp. OBS3]